MTTRRMAAGAIATALVLTLTACGGGGDKGDQSGSGDDEKLGALDQFWQDKTANFDEEESNAQMMEVEEKTAQCMSEQGFEYTPVDYSSMDGGMVAAADGDEGDGPQYGTLEFAKEFGYGVTTNPWAEEQPPTGAEDQQEWVDPNQDYVNAMSETEQTAYYAALYGEQPELTEEQMETYEWSWENSGCSGWAQHEVYGDAMMGGGDGEFKTLEEDMTAMYESLENDPRVAAAVSEWSSCMSGAGYPNLATIQDAENNFYEKVNAIYEESSPEAAEGDPAATSAEGDPAAANEAAIQEKISALTDEEIETAVADFTCRDEAGYTEIYQQVNIDLQQEFYDAHKAELEAYAESMGYGGNG